MDQYSDNHREPVPLGHSACVVSGSTDLEIFDLFPQPDTQLVKVSLFDFNHAVMLTGAPPTVVELLRLTSSATYAFRAVGGVCAS